MNWHLRFPVCYQITCWSLKHCHRRPTWLPLFPVLLAAKPVLWWVPGACQGDTLYEKYLFIFPRAGSGSKVQDMWGTGCSTELYPRVIEFMNQGLTVEPRLTLNPPHPHCLYLPSTEIIGVSHQVQWTLPAFRWKMLWARYTRQGIAGYDFKRAKPAAKLVLRICVLSELWVESLELVKLYFFLPASRIEFTLVQWAYDTVPLSCFVEIGRSHYFSLRNLQSN